MGRVAVYPVRVALYARVSTSDQQTLRSQLRAMRQFARLRSWRIVSEVAETVSSVTTRPRRQEILDMAGRREIDVVLVWRLDRWGRSVADLAVTLSDLKVVGVSFVSVSEAFDLTTSTGRAMAGLLSVFAEFERELIRERVRAGIQRAKEEGVMFGRPRTAARHKKRMASLRREGLTITEIARRCGVSRSSVRRQLGPLA